MAKKKFPYKLGLSLNAAVILENDLRMKWLKVVDSSFVQIVLALTAAPLW